MGIHKRKKRKILKFVLYLGRDLGFFFFWNLAFFLVESFFSFFFLWILLFFLCQKHVFFLSWILLFSWWKVCFLFFFFLLESYLLSLVEGKHVILLFLLKSFFLWISTSTRHKARYIDRLTHIDYQTRTDMLDR